MLCAGTLEPPIRILMIDSKRRFPNLNLDSKNSQRSQHLRSELVITEVKILPLKMRPNKEEQLVAIKRVFTFRSKVCFNGFLSGYSGLSFQTSHLVDQVDWAQKRETAHLRW